MPPSGHQTFQERHAGKAPLLVPISKGFTPVPRIQIVTIEEALELRDRAVRLPARRDDAFRKAAREEDRGAQGKLDL